MNSYDIQVEMPFIESDVTLSVHFNYTPADPGRIHPVDESREPIGEEVEILGVFYITKSQTKVFTGFFENKWDLLIEELLANKEGWL